MTTKNNHFKNFYNNMPAATQPGFISLVMQGCEVSHATVYRWLDNPEVIKKPYREKIAEIAGKTQLEVFGEEKPQTV